MKNENNKLEMENHNIEPGFERVVNGVNALIVITFIAGLIFKLTQMQL